MTFSLTRPPSPSRENRSSLQDGHDDDHLSSALHAALSAFVPSSSAHSDHHDMTKEKEKAGIDIIVDSDCLLLRGTGVDVEPALLKGHIVLHLTEATSIKEITLQFRGKARLPAPSGDALSLNTSSQWYSICNHAWSFLEGEKRHGHTLKAGFHQFPFQLQLGGSLPSSIVSAVNGAHVSYKLRAVAVRPGLAHNMQAVMPISVIRTFAPTALEYQQSLEIENTWPEKLMYSITLPHKAWAAGDRLTAIVKFSPIAKGVRVKMVTTTIIEMTKLQWRGGVQEHTLPVVTCKHEIVNAIPVPERYGFCVPTLQVPRGPQQPPLTPGLSSEDRLQSFGSLVALANQDLTLRQVRSTSSLSSSSQESHSHSVPGVSPLASYSASSAEQPVTSTSTAAQADHEDELLMSQNDVVTQLSLTIPKTVSPSHSLDPIIVGHRIRWSILMSNLDGHTSELRCSLPLHILDTRLLEEARANSVATRRLLLESLEVPVDEEQDVELPSYSAHIRDRVANMYLPDSATTRVLNPWAHSNVSPTLMPGNQSLSGVWTHSGTASPFMPPHPVSSHLPHVPQSSVSTPLDWVNSELLLSLSNSAPPRPRANASPHSHSPSDPASRSGSRPESRLMSPRGSRAPSPERHLTISSVSPTMTVSAAHEMYVHEGKPTQSLPGLFSNEMKPHTSHGWRSSRSNSHSNLSSLADASHTYRQGHGYGQSLYGAHGHGQSLHPAGAHEHGSHPTRASIVPQTPSAATDNMSESVIWHRAFTTVPDYDVASRGFIGGVTPLTSMRGLPSYEEVERSGADTGSGRGEEEEEEEGPRLTIGLRPRRNQTAGS